MMRAMVGAVMLASLGIAACAKSESAESAANEMRSRPPSQPPKVDDGFDEAGPADANNSAAN